eukprot:2399348-Rhodomonas_salina.2
MRFLVFGFGVLRSQRSVARPPHSPGQIKDIAVNIGRKRVLCCGGGILWSPGCSWLPWAVVGVLAQKQHTIEYRDVPK